MTDQREPTEDELSRDADQKIALFAEAAAGLQAWRRKWQHLPELAPVLAAIEAIDAEDR